MAPTAGIQAIVDVGASRGQFTIPAARANRDCRVIAVEPLASARHDLEAAVHAEGLTNVDIVPCAIGTVDGEAALQISSGLGELSSLRPLRANVKSDPYWTARGDVEMISRTVVPVRRLDALLADYGVAGVRFLKVDAQGADLDVLRSLGEMRTRVAAGMLEVATTRSRSLYASDDDLAASLRVLEELGFVLEAVKLNDPACNEVNLFFRAQGEEWGSLLAAIRSTEIPPIHEKDFWAFPSPHLDAELLVLEDAHRAKTALHIAETELHAARTELHTLKTELHAARTAVHALRNEVRALLRGSALAS